MLSYSEIPKELYFASTWILGQFIMINDVTMHPGMCWNTFLFWKLEKNVYYEQLNMDINHYVFNARSKPFSCCEYSAHYYNI